MISMDDDDGVDGSTAADNDDYDNGADVDDVCGDDKFLKHFSPLFSLISPPFQPFPISM